MRARWQNWLIQAEADLQWAEDSFADGHYAGVCFLCQQIGEKAVKALAYFRGADLVRGHSILSICEELELNGPVREAAARLDLYYISTRYPDALPSGAPAEQFVSSQASEALQLSRLIIARVKEETASGTES